MSNIRYFATDRLREWRKSRGYKVNEVAQLCSMEIGHEITRTLYTKWESKVHYMLPEYVLAISKITGIEPKMLVKGAKRDEKL